MRISREKMSAKEQMAGILLLYVPVLTHEQSAAGNI